MTTLKQVTDNLRYAASSGARHLAEEVKSDARAAGALGAALRVPGPGLRALSGEADNAAQVPPGVLADKMAAEAAAKGAQLAVGNR